MRNLIFLILALISLLLLAGGVYIANEHRKMKREIKTIALKHSKRLAEVTKTIERSARLTVDEELLTRVLCTKDTKRYCGL